MADVSLREVPDGVLAGVDAHAARLGISQVEYMYIRRRLAADAATTAVPVSVDDLRVRREVRRFG